MTRKADAEGKEEDHLFFNPLGEAKPDKAEVAAAAAAAAAAQQPPKASEPPAATHST